MKMKKTRMCERLKINKRRRCRKMTKTVIMTKYKVVRGWDKNKGTEC